MGFRVWGLRFGQTLNSKGENSIWSLHVSGYLSQTDLKNEGAKVYIYRRA